MNAHVQVDLGLHEFLGLVGKLYAQLVVLEQALLEVGDHFLHVRLVHGLDFLAFDRLQSTSFFRDGTRMIRR